jgi:hypothetical protein
LITAAFLAEKALNVNESQWFASIMEYFSFYLKKPAILPGSFSAVDVYGCTDYILNPSRSASRL